MTNPLANGPHWDELVASLRGEFVGLLRNQFGNFGDELIHRGTMELFHRHAIEFKVLSEEDLKTEHALSEITLFADPGGGNVGTRPGLSSPRRRRVLADLPGKKIVLPQSASDSGEDLSAFDLVYAREETSYQILSAVHSNVRLAPDLALALEFPESTPIEETGIFLRNDIERTCEGGVDPVNVVSSVSDYVALAGRYRHVVTNRLHFAIAALLQGRSVRLKANSYHKNRSMFDSWLNGFPEAKWED